MYEHQHEQLDSQELVPVSAVDGVLTTEVSNSEEKYHKMLTRTIKKVPSQFTREYFQEHASQHAHMYLEAFQKEYPDSPIFYVRDMSTSTRTRNIRVIIEGMSVSFFSYLLMIYKTYYGGTSKDPSWRSKAFEQLLELCGIVPYDKEYFDAHAKKDAASFVAAFQARYPRQDVTSIGDFATCDKYFKITIYTNNHCISFRSYIYKMFFAYGGERELSTKHERLCQGFATFKELCVVVEYTAAYFEEHAKRDADKFIAAYNEVYPEKQITTARGFSSNQIFRTVKADINGEMMSLFSYALRVHKAYGGYSKSDSNWKSNGLRKIRELCGVATYDQAYFEQHVSRDAKMFVRAFNEKYPDSAIFSFAKYGTSNRFRKVTVRIDGQEISFDTYTLRLYKAYGGESSRDTKWQPKAIERMKAMCGIKVFNREYFDEHAVRDVHMFMKGYNEKNPDRTISTAAELTTSPTFTRVVALVNGQFISFKSYLLLVHKAFGGESSSDPKWTAAALNRLKRYCGVKEFTRGYFDVHGLQDANAFVAAFNASHPEKRVSSFQEFSQSPWFMHIKAQVNGEWRSLESYLLQLYKAQGGERSTDSGWERKTLKEFQEMVKIQEDTNSTAEELSSFIGEFDL